jgi:hypothetical protein
MQNCAVSLNLANLSPTTYWDYDFNSLAVAYGELMGGSPLGLYMLDTGDTDAGDEILAKFRPLVTDFNDDHVKQVRAVVLGFESEGNLLVRMVADEQQIGEYVVHTDLVYSAQHGIRQVVDHVPVARYWSVEVENVDGVDFSVDKIVLGLILLNQKHADRSRHAKMHFHFPVFGVGDDNLNFPEFVIFAEGVFAILIDFTDFVVESTGTVA